MERHDLIAPGLFIEAPLKLRLVSRLPLAAKILAANTESFMDGLPAEHMKHPERFSGYRERMYEQLRHPGMRESLASTLLHYPFGAGAQFRRVGEHPRPVLLIWGDEDSATPYANVPRVRELYPRAELVTLRGARHAPHLDHADETHAAIIRFLRQ
jgi:pimeloyl-ACP methyl ester carboxylesterase